MKRFILVVSVYVLCMGPAEAQVCNALIATITGTDVGETIDGTAGNDVISE